MLTLGNDSMVVRIRAGQGGRLSSIGRPGGRNVLAASAGPRYFGGWQTMFPNAGDAGSGQPAHGGAFDGPWTADHVRLDSARLSYSTSDGLTLRRRVRVDRRRPVVWVSDRISNHALVPRPFLYGHHPVFRAGPRTVLDLPPDCRTVAGPTPSRSSTVESLAADSAEAVSILHSPGHGWAVLRPAAGPGIALSWQPATLPFLWIWLTRGDGGFTVGIEPVNAGSTAGIGATAVKAPRLAAGASLRTSIALTLLGPGPGP